MACGGASMLEDESDDNEEEPDLNVFVRDVIKHSTTDIKQHPRMSESEEKLFSKMRSKFKLSQDGASSSKLQFPDGDNGRFYNQSTPALEQHGKHDDGFSQKLRGNNKHSTSESLLYHRNHSEKLVLETLWGAKQVQTREEGLQVEVEDIAKELHNKIDFYRQISREDLNIIGEDEEEENKEVFCEGSSKVETKASERSRIHRLGNAIRSSAHSLRRVFKPCWSRQRSASDLLTQYS